MPQLNIPDYAPQIFWLVVTFLVLLFLMWTIALPRIGRVLERRQKHIDDDLAQAEKFKQGAEEAIKAYEASLADARAKAHQLLAETQARLDEQASAQRARLDAELAEKQASAESRIREAHQQALSSVRDVAADVARAATDRLIGVEPSQEAATAAVDGKG
jgi:F-type H+-transporting ATPase subunit b